MDATASGQPAPLSHVTITALLSCKNNNLPEKPSITLWLDDVTVAGRKYYPQAQIKKLDASRLQVSFDVPGGVYEMFLEINRGQSSAGDCSWNGPLMTLPGVERDQTVKLVTMIGALWDRGDFVAGSIPENAKITLARLPRPTRCGEQWKPDEPYELSAPQGGHYYLQSWFDTDRFTPALIVESQGHTSVLALAPIAHSPLVRHMYVRRDISPADLQQWAALAPSTIVCDARNVAYGASSPPAHANLQRVDVTTLIECSERNDLYSHETPTIEVEDQLNRGRFFYPPTRILSHKGIVIQLRFDVPPGAYDIGMYLPTPSEASGVVLGCYSSARFAVLRGHRRHLTFVISSSGAGGGDRGFVAGRLELRSVKVAVTTFPRNIPCGKRLEFDETEAYESRNEAAFDDGMFYATYNPYDPTKRPVLMIGGPGISYRFVALDADKPILQPLESLHVVDITLARASDWLNISKYGTLICST